MKLTTKQYNSNKLAIIVIGLLILLALLSLVAIIYLKAPRSSSLLSVCIYQNNVLTYEIPLSDVTTNRQITLYDSDNKEYYNIIEITSDSVRILDANCPDQTCVHMGAIRSSTFPIICLPHHLVIQLKETTDTLDAITY